MVCAFDGSGLSFFPFQALNLFTSPSFSFSSFCTRHLIIIELELEIFLLSFVSICEFDSEVRSQPWLWPAGMFHARLFSQAWFAFSACGCKVSGLCYYWKSPHRRRSRSEAVSHILNAWVYLIIPQVSLQHIKIVLIRDCLKVCCHSIRCWALVWKGPLVGVGCAPLLKKKIFFGESQHSG